MSEQQKDNSGALFTNKRREKDTHPHYTGQATIDGKDYWLSAWVNKSKKDGASYMSVAFKLKDAPQAEKADPEFDDKLPF
jgi:hypothetical protein